MDEQQLPVEKGLGQTYFLSFHSVVSCFLSFSHSFSHSLSLSCWKHRPIEHVSLHFPHPCYANACGAFKSPFSAALKWIRQNVFPKVLNTALACRCFWFTFSRVGIGEESLNWSQVQIWTLRATRYYTFLLQVAKKKKKKKSREGILDRADYQSWKSKSLFHSTLHNK